MNAIEHPVITYELLDRLRLRRKEIAASKQRAERICWEKWEIAARKGWQIIEEGQRTRSLEKDKNEVL